MSKLIKGVVGLSSVALALSTQCLPAAASTASSASATPSYHGTWYEGTAETCIQVPVSGRWSITLTPDGTASVSVTVFMEGALHAAWGGNALGAKFSWTRTAGGYDLALGDVEIAIDGDQVRFDIPQRYPGCDAYVLGTVAPVSSP